MNGYEDKWIGFEVQILIQNSKIENVQVWPGPPRSSWGTHTRNLRCFQKNHLFKMSLYCMYECDTVLKQWLGERQRDFVVDAWSHWLGARKKSVKGREAVRGGPKLIGWFRGKEIAGTWQVTRGVSLSFQWLWAGFSQGSLKRRGGKDVDVVSLECWSKYDGWMEDDDSGGNQKIQTSKKKWRYVMCTLKFVLWVVWYCSESVRLAKAKKKFWWKILMKISLNLLFCRFISYHMYGIYFGGTQSQARF